MPNTTTNTTTDLEDKESSSSHPIDVVDAVDELSRHIECVNSFIYMSNSAKFDELDGQVYDGFLYGISIINQSAERLITQIKNFVYETHLPNPKLHRFTEK